MTELVINEISFNTRTDNRWTVKEWMSSLAEVIKYAIDNGFSRSIRMTMDVLQKELASDYAMNNWLIDLSCDREKRLYLNSLFTKVSFIEDLQENWIREEGLTTEFFYNDVSATGLGYASLIDGMALSLQSADEWNRENVKISRRELDEEACLNENDEDVFHASRKEHVDENLKIIESNELMKVKNGRELWEKRNELFPSLDFCDSNKEQIISLHNPMFTQIKKKLQFLEQRADDDHFEPSRFLNATPESQSRLSEHKDKLTQICSDGISRLFSWHLSATPEPWRIYFEHQGEKKRFFIGGIVLKIGR